MRFYHYLAFFWKKTRSRLVLFCGWCILNVGTNFCFADFYSMLFWMCTTDLRIWKCRRFARKSTNTKQRPHNFYAQKSRFYSPFMLKKFEWAMFRIAKNNGEKWTVNGFSPQKASRRFGPARSTIYLNIRAVVNSIAHFFYFSAISRWIRGCAKIIPSLDSPRRVVPRTILPAFGALSGPNSPFSSWLDNWHFWTQVRNLRCFYENYHVLKNSAILRFHFSWPRKSVLPSKNP